MITVVGLMVSFVLSLYLSAMTLRLVCMFIAMLIMILRMLVILVTVYLNGSVGRMIECKTDDAGNKFWFLNGEYHREDGPAIEFANGNKSWYLHGKEVTVYDVLTDPREQFWWKMKS